jgi:lipopolysaccharide export system permease protein
MIFQRALRRELVSAAGAVFTTLFTITITFMLMKTLGQAASGKIASQDVVALLGFQALNYMPVILVLTCFISVLMAVTRSYQDSEMVVWFASGLSLSRWIKPVLSFGLPIVVLTAVLTFFVAPWANRQSAEFRERFEKREDISKVSPGKFQESASADRIFFVEGVSGDDNRVRNVFVNSVQNGRSSVVVAKEGTVIIDGNGDKFLVMSKGRRYDGVAEQGEQADFRVMEFERYGVLVSRQSQAVEGDKSARSMSTPALLADMNNPFNRGELLWRLSVPVMGVLLMLLGIPLGFVNPRGGRSANLMVALLAFVIYLNMINVFQAAVVQQRLPLAQAWWPIHLAAFLLLAFLFAWRLFLNSPYHPATMWGAMKRAILFRKAAQ